MKKVILICFLFCFGFSKAQNMSVQPNFGFNLWNLSFFDESELLTYMEAGATYEYGISDNLGVSAGASYNFSEDLDGGFTEITIGARYNLNKLNDGFFAGACYGYGFLEGANFMEFGVNAGYSIPLGPGSLNPNIGVGYASYGVEGFRFGGFHIPINVSYSIMF